VTATPAAYKPMHLRFKLLVLFQFSTKLSSVSDPFFVIVGSILSGSGTVDVTDGIVVDVTDGIVVDVTDGIVVDVTDGIVVDVTDGIVVDVTDGIVVDVTDGIVVDVTDGIVVDVTDGIVVDVTDALTGVVFVTLRNRSLGCLGQSEKIRNLLVIIRENICAMDMC
jgi:hypothetical protein